MPNAWTNVPKPTGAPYTFVNPQGKETYDQPDLLFDDPNVFYDGVNQTAWTDVLKPTLPIMYVGITQGLLVPLTYRTSVIGSDWTDVPKPTN